MPIISDSTFMLAPISSPIRISISFAMMAGPTKFAVDLGGVLEVYPSNRIVTRFEAGDTLIH